jgi:hypothetical protein
MSTIKSSSDHIVINADGASKDIKFQANGVQKASISSAGAFTSTTIDATVLTGDLPVISGANLTGLGGGITEADMWVLTADFTGDAEPISTNLARATPSSFNKLGTGMTQASGVFTFPSTGYWVVGFKHSIQLNGESAYSNAALEVTTNNSSYSNVLRGRTPMAQTTGIAYSSSYGEYIFDVTSTTTHKVRFGTASANTSVQTNGGTTAYLMTYFTFIRLGDT